MSGADIGVHRLPFPSSYSHTSGRRTPSNPRNTWLYVRESASPTAPAGSRCRSRPYTQDTRHLLTIGSSSAIRRSDGKLGSEGSTHSTVADGRELDLTLAGAAAHDESVGVFVTLLVGHERIERAEGAVVGSRHRYASISIGIQTYTRCQTK